MTLSILYTKEISICCVTETWLRNEIPDEHLTLQHTGEVVDVEEESAYM